MGDEVEPLFRAWPVFLVRAPMRCRDEGPGLSAADTGGGHLALLRAALADPPLLEAVTLASPSLAAVLDRIAVGRAAELRPKQLRRAALAVLRYDIRMRTRPTPFGLFAGVCAGEFGVGAEFGWGEEHRHRTHVDMSWLYRVVHDLESRPDVLPALRLRTHQSLLRRGDRVVLEVPSALGAVPGQQTRTVVSVRNSPVVSAALAAAATPVVAAELADELAARFSPGGVDRVLRLLHVLVDQELLITDLRPPLDGGDPLTRVIDRLAELPLRDAEPLARLRRLDEGRKRFDAKRPGDGRAELVELVGLARRITDLDTPLHVDTCIDAEVRLPHRVRDEVERLATVLWRLSPPRLGMRPLRGFHGRFLERYGVDRLVPIEELLDPTRSLGAPAGYAWPESEAAPEDPVEPSGTRRDRAISGLVVRALRDGHREVVLDDDLIGELAHDDADPADLPNSCELYLHVVDSAAEDFRVVVSPSPGSHHAGATFGRFWDLLPRWRGPVAVHVPGAVPVDLAFTPRSGKAANLAHTPPATGRRVAVGLPDAEGVEEIPPAEIAVGATLERLYVVHVPTNRELVPVLPNMVSPVVQAPNTTRFLYEIGMEGQRLWEPWNWGPMANSPFLPRVRFGRSVLAPATWRLDELPTESPRWAEEVAGWRARWRVPDQVLVVSTDQRLLLSLDDHRHLELLHDELRRNPGLVAQEVAAGASGGAAHERAVELVVPLVPKVERARPPHVAHVVPRARPPELAGDWLYLVVHGSVTGQDDLLRNHVPALVAAATEHGVDRWFFIRYTDATGHHLRLRFHGAAGRLWSGLLPSLSSTLADWQHDGLVGAHRIEQFDPELERYGGAAARTAAEELFCADSVAAVSLLRLAQEGVFPVETLGAISAASLAHAFGPPSPGAPWVDPSADPAVSWLSITGSRRELPDAYRGDAARWRSRIDPAGGWPELRGDDAGARLLRVLAARDRAAHAFGERIRALIAEGLCATPEARIVGSLLHMTCNRLLGGSSEREARVLGIARGAVQDNQRRRSRA
ncbi:lantibiotic dehydratase [Saccharothrix sp. BKS2]|uniref:lantibiotic dehydratase n=1 Tax=Saccharothrix sp. BKS2 TaxID=3064400 RepID=UPI0039EBD405